MSILQFHSLTSSDESEGKPELPKVDEGFHAITKISSPAVVHEDGFANIRARTTTKRKSIVGLELGDRDEDPGLEQPGDYRTAQVFSGWSLAKVSFQSLGVIYGDIGTSPLYVYSSTFTEPPNKQDLVGVLSLILWSLFLMVTVKYVIIILNADNDGEGGTFSTYSLLCRYLNITDRDPREKSLVQMRRMDTGDLESTGKHLRRGIETSKVVKTSLKIIGVFAVTMVLSDGVLTPAQSVLGAIQGIQVAAPNISKGTIIGVTDAILILLFLVQPLGVSRITIVFAPIVLIWLGFNAVFGVYNLVKYDASVFKAFYPYYAFDFLIRHKEEGWRRLGGVLLAFTGVEALFADLGAFSKRAIQISWLGYVLPCLVLAYTGQAAFIGEQPEAYSNPFFNAAPPGTLYPALVIAILAAVVASQAIITASFQLLAQVMKLSYFPQLRVIHTSKIYHGQLYIPVANWLLMIGTVLVASIYNNTTSLGNAYGVCVMFVTFFDTLMVTLVAIFVWGLKPLVVVLPWLVFACLDGTFLSAVLTKVPDGAWFTLTLSIVLASIFLLWRYGKEQQWTAEAKDRFPTSHFIAKSSCGDLHLTDRFNGTQLSTIRGFGIFFDKAGETTPVVFSQFVLKLTTLPEVMIFFHLRPLDRPFVPSSERYTVSRLAVPSCYRVVVRYGFNDDAITPDLGHVIYQQVRSWLMGKGMMRNSSFLSGIAANHDNTGSGSTENGDAENHDDARNHSDPSSNSPDFMTNEVRLLDKAFTHNVLFITGKEQMKIGHSTSYLRATLLWAFLWIRDNTRNRIANLKLPVDQIVEVGFLKEI
ncbi:potassium uptake protein [Kwoniella bestiolae CBS 10118]|uniref:Potassium uptake protein n=1 Tax=Kwoniella bestiolae CBS 10118 TaxID=1296100 RepID=A0A1B9FVD9_9TREE|nr:potassium uptake protein [Kwoniella bestiolae CBS 10118]OCF22721.1 potassium uptake protein [Kwoniella bestiolae CBS 10118]